MAPRLRKKGEILQIKLETVHRYKRQPPTASSNCLTLTKTICTECCDTVVSFGKNVEHVYHLRTTLLTFIHETFVSSQEFAYVL